MGGLALAARDREDAGPHDLGDEGRGVDRQRHQGGKQLDLDLQPADEAEPAELGVFPVQRETQRRRDDQRKPDQERDRDPQNRELLAGFVLAPARPSSQQENPGNGDRDGDQDEGKPWLRDRFGCGKAAVVDKDRVQNLDRLSDQGQGLEHGEVPEQELQQQRDVANGLYIHTDEA